MLLSRLPEQRVSPLHESEPGGERGGGEGREREGEGGGERGKEGEGERSYHADTYM